ncbi:hypothetical protein [Sphaerisporangium album]|nr:hypothetical protein [Sphaerisporangium album]
MKNWNRFLAGAALTAMLVGSGATAAGARTAEPVQRAAGYVQVADAGARLPISYPGAAGDSHSAPASAAGSQASRFSVIWKALTKSGSWSKKAASKARQGYTVFRKWWKTVPWYVRKPVEIAAGGHVYQIYQAVCWAVGC